MWGEKNYVTVTGILCVRQTQVNGLFSRTTWVSLRRKGWTNLDFNETTDDRVAASSGISWTICKSFVPRSRQKTTPAPRHWVFTGWMLFLTPNQQREGTAGKKSNSLYYRTCRDPTNLAITTTVCEQVLREGFRRRQSAASGVKIGRWRHDTQKLFARRRRKLWICTFYCSIGRPFVKRFALADRCLTVCPVCVSCWCIVAKLLDGSRCHLVVR